MDLLVVGIDTRSNRGGFGEVEWRSRHWPQFARRDQCRVDRSEAVGIDHQFFAENIAFYVAGEIEIAVVRQIDDRRLRGLGLVIDAERVVVVERVGHVGRELPGISFFTVGADIGEDDARAHLGLDRFRRPKALIETLGPPMKTIGRIVDRQMILHAVQRKGTLCDPIAVAADRGAEERHTLYIIVDRIEPQDDIFQLAGFVGGF